MKYPPHVQNLLDNLSPEQAQFQRRCIGMMLGTQILVGMLFAFAGIGFALDHYVASRPVVPALYQAFLNEFGALASYAYGAACFISILIGVRLMRA